jgi:PTH1 family peptidyl-tRNA hydrolase
VERPARIVLGLGNPGRRYAGTRHNVGFMVVDALARDLGVSRWRKECAAEVAAAELSGCTALLAKPLTYMNGSGEAAVRLLERYELDLGALLVVADDLNLPFGKIRVRARGSSGGQLGLESVLSSAGSREIARVRLGIGEEKMPEDRTEFVLGPIPAERREAAEEMIARACDAVRAVIAAGVERAMSLYNA